MIDEFYGWIPCAALLRLLDGYTYKILTSGGVTSSSKSNFTDWSKVFITSNVHPDNWYTGGKNGEEYGDLVNSHQRDALMRRLTRIVYMCPISGGVRLPGVGVISGGDGCCT